MRFPILPYRGLAGLVSTALLFPPTLVSAASVTYTFPESTNLSRPAEHISADDDLTVIVNNGKQLSIAPLCRTVDTSVGCYKAAENPDEVGSNSGLRILADTDNDSVGNGQLIIGNDGTRGTVAMVSAGLTVKGQNSNITIGRNGGAGNLWAGICVGEIVDYECVDNGDPDARVAGGGGGSLTVIGDQSASLVLGTGGPLGAGTGELFASSTEIEIKGNLAAMEAGASEGSSAEIGLLGFGATLRVTGGSNGSEAAAVVVVGEGPGSSGIVSVESGNLIVSDDSRFSELWVGAPRGLSQTVEQAELDANGGAPLPGGFGRLSVVDGGFAFANSVYVGVSAKDLGFGVGSTGELIISGDGTNRYETFPSSGVFFEEYRVSTLVADEMYVGAFGPAGGGQSSGTVTVTNGGVLDLDGGDLWIGSGGYVNGNGGTIKANVTLDGGSLAPGSSPGRMDIVGDFNFLAGIVQIEIDGTEEGQFDVLNLFGNVIGDLKIDLLVANGLDLASAPVNFLNIEPDPKEGAVGGALPSSISFLLNGVELGTVGFGGTGRFIYDGASVSLAQDPNALAPVPLPAGFPLMLVGLGGLVASRMKRNAAKAAASL